MAHPSLAGYSIEFSKESLKFLHKLDRRQSLQIIAKIKELCSGAEHLNIKKLKSSG